MEKYYVIKFVMHVVTLQQIPHANYVLKVFAKECRVGLLVDALVAVVVTVVAVAVAVVAANNVGVTIMVFANHTWEKLLQIVLIVEITFPHVIAITVSQIQMQIVGQVMAMLDVVIG
jgi:hypothetical protein